MLYKDACFDVSTVISSFSQCTYGIIRNCVSCLESKINTFKVSPLFEYNILFSTRFFFSSRVVFVRPDPLIPV